MEIRRVTSQGPVTLVERYQQVVDSAQGEPEWRAAYAQSMLNLLRALSADGSDLVLWGLTSLDSLMLMTTDNWEARRLVTICPTGVGMWCIECGLPPEMQPWPEATVCGHTDSLAEVVRRVKLGLGWAGILPR